MSVETKTSSEASEEARLAATRKTGAYGHASQPDPAGPPRADVACAGVQHDQLLDIQQHHQPAPSGLDDRNPGDGRDLCHHYGRHRSVGRRCRGLRERHRCLVADARLPDLGLDHHHARVRLRHRRFSWLRNHQTRLAAVHHDAGYFDGAARCRSAHHKWRHHFNHQ